MKNYLIPKESLMQCKYFDTPCDLGHLAPECNMTCELNVEAKEYLRHLNQNRSDSEIVANNKGISYIELLTAIGISGIIAASIALAGSNTKERTVKRVEEYATSYEQIDDAIETSNMGANAMMGDSDE